MAPMAPMLESLFLRRDFDTGAPAAAFSHEWSQPSNYAFTILLLLGGDLINRALAQLAGGLITPVAFSFGKLKLHFNIDRQGSGTPIASSKAIPWPS